MKLRHRTPMACAAVLLALTTAAAPASAAPILHEHFEDAGTGLLDDFCGGGDTVSFDFHVSGTFMYLGNQQDGLPYYREDAHLTNTLTNLSNGKTATHRINIAHKDTQVTDNGDGTLTVTFREASGGDHWFDSNGRLVLPDTGVVWTQILVDDGGTPTDPTDDEFIDSLGDVKVVGQEGNVTDENFCDLILAVLG